jgi:aromatic ring-opening dioxygenase catalytic subunit (LigB family)
MPLLNKDDPCAMELRSITASIKTSHEETILVITAHWVAHTGFQVSTGISHSLLFDYSGFLPNRVI